MAESMSNSNLGDDDNISKLELNLFLCMYMSKHFCPYTSRIMGDK